MGYNLEFFAFNEKPDSSVLLKIKWLQDWRLFEEKSINAWYLIGQFEDDLLVFNFPKITHSNIPSEVNKLVKEVSDIIQRGEYIPNRGVATALSFTRSLSQTLCQSVLCVQSDDDGSDGGCIYDNGKLQHARFEYDWNRAFSIDNKKTLPLKNFTLMVLTLIWLKGDSYTK